MSKDLEIIKIIEESIGITFKRGSSWKSLSTAEYTLNKNNEVTSINLARLKADFFLFLILRLKNLQFLNLDGNQLTELPQEIIVLENLQSLYLNNNQLKVLPEKIGELKNLKTLNLSGNHLSNLPKEIGKLKSLQILNLEGNQLTELPQGIIELKNLQKLNLSSNELIEFPLDIKELKNLQSLNLENNQLIELPKDINELKNLQSLNVYNNKLSELPQEIIELKNLQSLHLHNNQLKVLPEKIGEFKNLQTFDLHNNLLKVLPGEIGELKNLQTLHFHNNQLKIVYGEIGELKNLKTLNLSGNQLSNLPMEIGKLENLQILNLLGNQLTEVPQDIGKLINLKTLILRRNRLTELPPDIGELKNLKTLNLSSNQLSNLPKEIRKLEDLQILNLHNNRLTELPREIEELINLRKLYLDTNQFSKLPVEIIGLKNLETLHLQYNQLKILSQEIGELKNLQRLNLLGNQLTDLPQEIIELRNLKTLNLKSNLLKTLPRGLIELKNLQILNLSNNQLTELPREIVELDSKLYLEHNPLLSPPKAIALRGKNAIKEYFKSLEISSLMSLNEIKVLFVGEGGVGKTSLLKKLFEEDLNPNEPATHGINIRDWKTEDTDRTINVHFWDFGGQEIMHSTHQFFLSEHSFYVLIIDGRKDEKTENWLNIIESFGGTSPILVVINKIDENISYDVNRRLLMEKYKNIKGFCRISCKTDEGILEFKNRFIDEINKIKHIEEEWPERWFKIKETLENMDGSFITFEEYKDICIREFRNMEESEQDTLVDFLHDLGVILHFRDVMLLDTYVLNPKWVTEAVYKILNSKILSENKGILKMEYLDDILRKNNSSEHYPRDRDNFFVNLMNRFELCFKIDDETVLIPDVLDVQEPEFDFNYDDSLKFLLEYNFLPKSIMPRFIVKMHRDIKEDLRWRTGVVLNNKDFKATALIKSDDEAKNIYIYVNGEQRRDYFAVILSIFRSINNDYMKLGIKESVLLSDSKNPVSYEHLIELENFGILESPLPGGSGIYNIQELLGTVQNENKTEDDIVQILVQIISILSSKINRPEDIARQLDDQIKNIKDLGVLGIPEEKLDAFMEKDSKQSQLIRQEVNKKNEEEPNTFSSLGLFLKISDNQLRKSAESIHKYCEKQLTHIHATDKEYFHFFTNHASLHSINILERLDEVLSQVDLESYEYYLLYSAAYAHDIGMLPQKTNEKYEDFSKITVAEDARKNHAKRSADHILKNWKKMGIPEYTYAVHLASICKAHSSKMDINKIEETAACTINQNNVTIKWRFLAALIRFADFLDADYNRIPPEFITQKQDLSEETKEEYIKHTMVQKVTINHFSHEIYFDLLFNDEKEMFEIRDKLEEHLNEEFESVKEIINNEGVEIKDIKFNETITR